VAEGGPVQIGAECIVMENAVIRGTRRHPIRIGHHVLVGLRAEVRINGVVHLKTNLPSDAVVPIDWVAVGDPAQILPPHEHEKIWAIQEPLDFPREVFGLERAPIGETIMPELTRCYAKALGRHREDLVLGDG
jgi:carbonic anhydrase/acetyltransferase-like protein (isoleucine patch superfamily)